MVLATLFRENYCNNSHFNKCRSLNKLSDDLCCCFNDFFYISGNGIDKKDFMLTVYNRWGERMFKTTTFDMESPQNMAWDGTDEGNILKGDKIVTTGAYNWVCKFTDFTGKPHEKKGTVFLLK
mgnify:CR=1 FL=1